MNDQSDQVIRISFTWIVLAVALILLLGVLGGVVVVALWPPVATPLSLDRGLIPQVREVTISPNKAWAEVIARLDRSIIYLQGEDDSTFLGNGIVVTNDGLIATTAALPTTGIVGVDYDGKEIALEHVGRDIMTGISFLRMREGVLPPLDLRTESVSVGTELAVLSRSAPSFELRAQRIIAQEYRLPLSASSSGVQRVLQGEALLGTGWTGAPLIDENEHVSGIVLDQATGTALPVEILRVAMARIARGEREKNPFEDLGIRGQYGFISTERGQQFGFTILSVVDGSPADALGLQPGDVLVAIGDTTLSWESLVFDRLHEPPAQVGVIRDDDAITLTSSR